MALKGKLPEPSEKRAKILLYGPAGVGKTTAAIQMPRPYLIDTERGATNDQYVEMIRAKGGAYMFTTDADEVIDEVTALLSEKHEYRTLIIDPLTVIYNDLVDTSAIKVGTDFGRHKIEPDRKIKHLCKLLTKLDMNVVITSHSKGKWVRTKDNKGKEVAVQEGNTFDCYPRLEYLFDLVFEIDRRGKDRVGIVRKSRVKGFPEDETFPFNYDEIANRYGRAVLERDAVALPLATADQLARLKAILADHKNGEALLEAAMTKADVDRLEELTEEQAAKWLAHMTKGAA